MQQADHKITITTVRHDEAVGYLAEHEDFPGHLGAGETLGAALKDLADKMQEVRTHYVRVPLMPPGCGLE